jgi:hypothetical protein
MVVLETVFSGTQIIYETQREVFHHEYGTRGCIVGGFLIDRPAGALVILVRLGGRSDMLVHRATGMAGQ